MVGSDSEGPDISELFCHYNALYFKDSLGSCAVSWANDPLPNRDLGGCDYYPGGGGCIILLSRSLYECYTDSDLKNVLLHEMIHAYICVKDNNDRHSEHGTKFQRLMSAINSHRGADPLRPDGGYNITMLHGIRKKYYQHECESCGDLVKSIKIRGPSQDDCIEKMGANDSCENSLCHWHRHKKRCSGGYHRAQELSPGRVEIEGSKASAEEALDEAKAEESSRGSWHAMQTSKKRGKNNKHEPEDASTEFLQPSADDAIGLSGPVSSSRDISRKKIKLSKDIGLEPLTITPVQEVAKRTRTAAAKNQECSRQKKRKLIKWDGSYSVVIEWLNLYCVDESEEDEVPLINKRTERRKRQRLLKIAQPRESKNVDEGASSTYTVNGTKAIPGNKSKVENMPASQVDERLLPYHPVGSHVVAGDQASHGISSTPLSSPIRGEIVDISDG